MQCQRLAVDRRQHVSIPIARIYANLVQLRAVDHERLDVVPGRVVKDGRGAFLVEAGRGVIEAREIQYPGRKRLSASEFLMGASIPEGMILGR